MRAIQNKGLNTGAAKQETNQREIKYDELKNMTG